jgi:hypothetical protein
MKRFILSIVAIIVGACSFQQEQVDEIPQEPTRSLREPPKTSLSTNDPQDEYSNTRCSTVRLEKFMIDGKQIVLRIPTLCDPMPYLELGDPPPFYK